MRRNMAIFEQCNVLNGIVHYKVPLIQTLQYKNLCQNIIKYLDFYQFFINLYLNSKMSKCLNISKKTQQQTVKFRMYTPSVKKTTCSGKLI